LLQGGNWPEIENGVCKKTTRPTGDHFRVRVGWAVGYVDEAGGLFTQPTASEKAVIRLCLAHASSLYRQMNVIYWLKAMSEERDKML